MTTDRDILSTTARPSITCPRCGRTSHNPIDVRERYCGVCHDWTGLEPGEPVLSQERT